MPFAPCTRRARLARGLLAGLLLAVLPGGSSPARAERIDRVLAVVGDRAITVWDLRFDEFLSGHLTCPEAPLCDPARPPLERAVDRTLIRGLAGDASTYRPDSEEVQARLADLRETWPDATDFYAALRSLGLTERELAGLLFSRLVVERYVQRHVGLQVLAAGGDADAYRARYAAWIADQRKLVQVRFLEPEP